MTSTASAQIYGAFRNFFGQHCAIGTLGAVPGAGSETDTYMPADVQTWYFNIERVRETLERLFPKTQGWLPVHSSAVQADYKKVFATLLYIGKGDRIGDFVQKYNLNDTHLPFEERPRDFPDEFDPYFEDFFEAQWKFCVPLFKYNRRFEWNPKQILPFERRDKLGEGYSGTAYRIYVHPAHDLLATSGDRSQNPHVSDASIASNTSGYNEVRSQRLFPR